MSFFSGSIVALITPLKVDFSVDYEALEALLDFHAVNDTAAIVACGTTGQSSTLSHDEHNAVVEFCCKHSKIPVIAGAGSNNTAEAIELTNHAEQIGAKAALSITPYYNKPTQQGLYQHFKQIHDLSAIPIILYDVPSRCGIGLSNETVVRLATDCQRIVGIKDATADLSRPSVFRHQLGQDFCLLSGDDASTLGFYAQGGDGAISVTANIRPKQCSQVHQLFSQAKVMEAQKIHNSLIDLHLDLFIEANPVPVVYALSKMGMCNNIVRSPLTTLSKDGMEKIDKII
jgi:4-hydroxy-tetrahydrodipicolinate synthase